MKAFKDTMECKEAAIARAEYWRNEGGFYAGGHKWFNNKGDVSGAMYHAFLDKDQHPAYSANHAPQVHGIPILVASIIDDFFGGLSCNKDKSLHQHWAERVYEAIEVGADLSAVPDKMALYFLENKRWMLDYADDKGKYLIGLMTGLISMRVAGLDTQERMKAFYFDHIYKLHRHETEGQRDSSRYVLKAMSCLSSQGPHIDGAWHYFIQSVCHGYAAHNRDASHGGTSAMMANIFIDIIKEAPTHDA